MAEMYLPDASGLINAFSTGEQAGMTDRKRRASTTAAGLMTGGDYKGAAGALYGVGDFQGGSAIAKADFDQADRTDKVTRQKAVRDAVAKGDLSGAYAAAGADSELLGGLDKIWSHTKETHDLFAASLQALKGPDGNWLPADQARAKYQVIKPQLTARGLDAKMLDGFDPTPANLDTQQSQVLGLEKQLELTKPDWHEVKSADGSSAFKDLNPHNRQTGADAPVPTSTAPAAPAQVAAAPDPNLPRGLRNNNPLNLEATVQWNGMNGSDGRYATFGAPEDGWKAADRNLSVYGSKHGINTIAGVINRWAPPSENDTAGYVREISSAVGIDPNAKIDLTDPMVRRKVLEAMATVENGHPVAWGSGGQAEPVKATPAATASRPIGDGVPTIAGSSAQPVQWVQDGKGNLVNAKTGDRKVDPTFDGIGAADPNVVKLVLDGRYPPPTGRAAADPKWQAVLQAAAAEDPNFNAADYHTRFATRKDFTSGKASQNITALNTALGHIGELAHKIDGLGNTSFTPFNEVKNYIADKTGDPRYQAFNTDKKAVASELVRVFRGAGGAEADIKDFQAQLDSAGSPAQLHAVTQEMVKLLASRLDSLAVQYKQGLGQDKAGIEFLTPKAAAIYSQITGVAAPSGSQGGGSSSPAPVAAGARPPLDSFRKR